MENQTLDIGCIIPQGYSNPLFYNLIWGLRSLGHRCEVYKVRTRYDFVFVCNVSSPYHPERDGKNWILKYPNLDVVQDKVVFVDPAEYGWWTHDPAYGIEYYNAFAPWSIRSKGSAEGQIELLNFLRGKSFPYFIREKYKSIQYPDQYYPVDYPLANISKKPDKDEFMKRVYDLYLRWGGSHLFRPKIVEEINSITGFKIDAVQAKINQFEYYTNTQNSRVSVVSDGYGSGSFRETEILANCVLFMREQCIDKHHPLTNGINFVEFKVNYEMTKPDSIFVHGYQIYKDCNIKELLLEYMSDWDRCYSIYEAGYNHCMKYYSQKEFANYVLEKIYNFDYLKSTPVEYKEDRGWEK